LNKLQFSFVAALYDNSDRNYSQKQCWTCDLELGSRSLKI